MVWKSILHPPNFLLPSLSLFRLFRLLSEQKVLRSSLGYWRFFQFYRLRDFENCFWYFPSGWDFSSFWNAGARSDPRLSSRCGQVSSTLEWRPFRVCNFWQDSSHWERTKRLSCAHPGTYEMAGRHWRDTWTTLISSCGRVSSDFHDKTGENVIKNFIKKIRWFRVGGTSFF